MPDTVKPQHPSLSPEQHTLRALWRKTVDALLDYERDVASLPVAPRTETAQLRRELAGFHFRAPRPPEQVLDFVLDGMRTGQLHTASPAYYGVFNPKASSLGVLGEAIAAGFNPQLASYPSAPFALEIERHLVRQFARLFGYTEDGAEGIFTSGGTEANHTAVLAALTRRFPEFAENGARSLPGEPVIYVSREAHHSFLKAARLTGLGTRAVREVDVDSGLALDPAKLSHAISGDRARGLVPLLVVATVGSTNGGTVDPIAAVAEIAQRESLWLHVDAAWGGAAVLLPELGYLFEGIERADSITLDAHKWLSVPMTAGLFLCRHPGLLERTFRVGGTTYMPNDSVESALPQPYAQSMGWSRRFRGLKLFLTLATAGWEGYERVLRHQVAMGKKLRERLETAGYRILNPTELPVACFVDTKRVDGGCAGYHDAVARHVAASGRSWLTTTRLSTGQACLRAGIASFATTERELELLIELLEAARREVSVVEPA